MALGGEVGVAERLVFLGSVPYTEALHLAAGATVGCSLVADQNDPNWTYSAGAINKRFEYMAVGLPQLADCGIRVPELVEQTGCGLCVPSDSPEAIGQALSKLILNEAMRKEMGTRARQLHLERFNYETEFQPVMRQVLAWLREGPRSCGPA
jgi:glycosyltransferase involved in cell wall biosynthesis